jgi:GTPase SAR1 family protein
MAHVYTNTHLQYNLLTWFDLLMFMFIFISLLLLLNSAYYRGALGAMLVYDVNKQVTFDSIPRWLRELKDHAHREITLLMVGNKVDISADNPSAREVTAEQAQAQAEELGLPLLETSAKTGQNVEAAFVSIVERIYQNTNALQSTQNQQQVRQSQQTNVQLNAQNLKRDRSSIDDLKQKCCS